MSSDVLLIFLGVTTRQEKWWETYEKLDAGMDHDVVIAYIDRSIIPKVRNNRGRIIHESKIIDGKEIPLRAFGAYRYFFNKYKHDYKYLGFVSDDVLVRSANWLKKCIDPLNLHKNLAWTSTQIYSTASKCFPDHLRAPIWFAKSEALDKINWQFKDDHNGEISIANQFLAAGFFGIQVGHKFDIAYDSLEKGKYHVGDGIVSCFEKKYFPSKNLELPFSELEIQEFKSKIWESIYRGKISHWFAVSPYPHIGKKNFITELQGLDGQVYLPALSLARECVDVYEVKKLNIQVLQKYAIIDEYKETGQQRNILGKLKKWIKRNLT